MTSTDPASDTLLSVSGLRTQIKTENGLVTAVDGVSFDVRRGETLAIVGESGCGKTMTALSLLNLLPKRGEVVDGSVVFDGRELVGIPSRKMRAVRGAEIAMIFQDALTGLNPVQKVGNQIIEMIRTHRNVSKAEARKRAVELLDLVGIPNAADRADSYVHEFSGGMRQRAMIAMAIALEPKLLIADEPTTALDVTVQAQVLEVLQKVQERLGSSIILITHDLGVVAGVADRVMVMYAGREIETGLVGQIYNQPTHPYTWGLMRAMPRLDSLEGERLVSIAGAPPNLISPPSGCRFAPRCFHAKPVCEESYPAMHMLPGEHGVACHFATEPGWSQVLTEVR